MKTLESTSFAIAFWAYSDQCFSRVKPVILSMERPGFFDQTSWTTVLAAGSGDEAVRLAALERLLGRYRAPILLDIRLRARCDEGEAEELGHQFIHNCLQRNFLNNIDPKKGRFRSYIKACIVNFLRDVHRQKIREPEKVSLQETNENGLPLIEPAATAASPELLIDAKWAIQVVNLAREQLEKECIAARRGPLFTALKPFLTADPQGGYAEVAAQLGMKEGAVRTATHRMRQRLGELIQAEIKETVATEEDWREELRYLLDLVGQNSFVT